MRRVKSELGPDAVILSTQTVHDKEERFCEITAALDGPLPDDAAAAPQSPPETASEEIRPGWGEWHREWDVIKSHLMALMKPQLGLDELTPRQRMALEYLGREGVGEGVLLSISRELKEDPQRSVLASLGRIVRVRPIIREQETFMAVSGPGGAGKTSTLLRAALAYSRSNPEARILLGNMDSMQGNGRLFLKHYAELSKMYYADMAGWAEKDILALERKFDKIFIDLPGLTGDLKLEEHLTLNKLGAVPNLAVHLVLSPHYSARQLDAFLRKYKSSKTAGLIWTKCDEACIFGALINVAYATGVPVSGLSIGPGIRGSLVAAREVDLWRMVFKHELPESPIKEKTNAGYAH
jgi:flagellar biosynthesis protein FlhF